MADIVELNIYGQKFRRFQRGGENVVVTMTRHDDKKNTSSSIELGRMRFDMNDRRAGKPDKVIAAVRKAMSGEYERKGCNMLGFTFEGDKCTDKPLKATKGKAPARSQAPNKQGLKTTIAKRK